MNEAGPIIVGVIVDATCLYWEGDSKSRKCIQYNSKYLSLCFLPVSMTAMMVAFVMMYLALRSYRKSARE